MNIVVQIKMTGFGMRGSKLGWYEERKEGRKGGRNEGREEGSK